MKKNLLIICVLSVAISFLSYPLRVLAKERDSLSSVMKGANSYTQNSRALGEAEVRALFWRAVSEALYQSPALNSAKATWQASEESVSEAKGQRWPQIDLTSNSRSVGLGSGERAVDDQVATFGLNVVTNLYDFGQLNQTIQSREEKVDAAKFGVRAEMENIAWQVSNAMIELNKQQLLIQISNEYVSQMDKLVTMLQGIVNSDAGRRSELTQATSKLLQAQSQLNNAVARARDYEIILSRYLGNLALTLPNTSIWRIPPQNLEAQLGQVSMHPQILQARADVQSARSEAKAIRSSGLPSLNWVVSKSTAKDYNGREQALETGIQLSWGVFRGGSTLASEKAALLRAEASKEKADDQLQELKRKVIAADQDAKTGLQRAELYLSLTKESDKIRHDFYEQWYHLGKRSLLDVLTSENDYYNNRVNEVTNRFDAYNAIFKGYADSGTLIPWLQMKNQG